MKVKNRLKYSMEADDKISLNWNRYQNGRIALELIVENEDGFREPLARASVNLPNLDIPDNAMFVKDYSENEGMVDTLIESGIIEPHPVGYALSGFEMINAYELTPAALADAGVKPYRHHTCMVCNHEWDSDVVLAKMTQNLSGEESVECPECGSYKKSVSSPFKYRKV